MKIETIVLAQAILLRGSYHDGWKKMSVRQQDRILQKEIWNARREGLSSLAAHEVGSYLGLDYLKEIDGYDYELEQRELAGEF